MSKALSRLLAFQAGLTLVLAAGFYMYQGPMWAVTALYGGVTAMVVSALLAFRLAHTNQSGASMFWLFMSTFERFAFVGGAFVVGVVVLKLPVIPLLVGFIGAEIGYFFLATGFIRGGSG